MNNLMNFKSDTFGEIRAFNKDNSIWFVGKDVAEKLGYAKPNNAINKHVDIDDTSKWGIIDNLGRVQESVIINESGLYSLVLSSKLPGAKSFKRWITGEVLPQIRQTGGYINIQEEDDAETLMARALMVAQKTLAKKDELLKAKDNVIVAQDEVIKHKEIELADKNRFINQIAASNDCILIGDLAHLITKQGFKIGQNRLFAKLRDWKLLQQNNKPYQRSLEQGLFEVSEFAIQTNHGIKLRHTTRVTGKGQVYIIEKILKENQIA